MVEIKRLVESVVLGFVLILIALKLAVVLVPTLGVDLTNLSARGGLWSIMSSAIVVDLLIPAGMILLVITVALSMFKTNKK